MWSTKSFKFWLLQVFILLVVLAFFTWLSLRPKNPTFYIRELALPLTNTTANQIMPSGNLSFNLEIDNPNKNSDIFYEDILLMFTSNEEAIGEKQIPSFHQRGGKTTKNTGNLDINQIILQKLANMISNKTAALKANLKTGIRFRTWGVKSKRHKIHMDGVVTVGSNGKMEGKKKTKLKKASYKWKKAKFI